MADFPIEELARLAGMSVRNVRAYVSRGLLPPGRMQGRAARYSDEHLDRLDLVNGLRRRGFSLAAIEVLVRQDTAQPAEDALRLYRGMLAPWQPEEPMLVDADGLAEWLGLDGAAAEELDVAALVDAGLVERAGAGRLRVLRPELLRAGADAVRLGITQQAVLDLHRDLDGHCERIAELFVALFADQVWARHVADGMPAERAPEIQSVVEQLQPVATRALLSSFRSRMQATMDGFIERISEDLAPSDAGRALGVRTGRRS